MRFLENGVETHDSATGLYGVTLSRVLTGTEVVELRDEYGRLIHRFQSPSAGGFSDPEDPMSTGKAIMLTTHRTTATLTDHDGNPLIVTFSINKV